MALHEFDGCHDDLARALIIVQEIEAVLSGRMIEQRQVRVLLAPSAETDRVLPHRYLFDGGFMHPGDAPGLGVDIDESLAAKFPYERALSAGEPNN